MRRLRILQLGDAVRKRAERSSGTARASWCSRVPILGGNRFGTCPRGPFAHYFLPISINWGTRGLARAAYLHHEARKRGWGGYTWCTLKWQRVCFLRFFRRGQGRRGPAPGAGAFRRCARCRRRARHLRPRAGHRDAQRAPGAGARPRPEWRTAPRRRAGARVRGPAGDAHGGPRRAERRDAVSLRAQG